MTPDDQVAAIRRAMLMLNLVAHEDAVDADIRTLCAKGRDELLAVATAIRAGEPDEDEMKRRLR